MLNNQRRKSVAEIAVLATQGIQSLSGGIDLPSPEPTDVDLRNQTLNDVAKATMVGVFKTASSHSKQHCWYLLILLIGYYMLYILLYDVMIILAVSMGIGIFSSQTVLWHGIEVFFMAQLMRRDWAWLGYIVGDIWPSIDSDGWVSFWRHWVAFPDVGCIQAGKDDSAESHRITDSCRWSWSTNLYSSMAMDNPPGWFMH